MKIFRASFLHLIKDTDRDMQLKTFKVETTLNDDLRLMDNFESYSR